MLFIGQTRFSLFKPKAKAWRASNGSRFSSQEEYKQYLFSERRLDLRAEIFINQSLPQLELAGAGHEIRHIVSYSDDLPHKYQDALRDAAQRYPFLMLDCSSRSEKPVQPEDVARELVLGTGEVDPTQAFGIYRLDDDDLIPVSFFDRNAAYIRPDNAGMQISLGTGITALHLDGSYYNARRCYFPMIAIGLMSVCRFLEDGALLAPKPAAHNVSDRTNPVILDSRKIGYLWLRHADQDTALGTSLDAGKVVHRIRERMDEYPAVTDMEEVAAEFPVVADRLFRQAGPGMTRQVLVSAPQPVGGEGLALPFPEASGYLELHVEVDCGAGAVQNNAVVSFDLVASGGGPLNPATMQRRLRETGLYLSNNPAIGYFQYVNTIAGQSASSHRVWLPEGVACRGVSLRPWKRLETPISARSIALLN